ncbi:hypothetical protein KCP69_18695 [Salmonella enterica subsp. enterica]|nr:hypothetical protein KCP69_18695 [Salmonella enterica subsp. enterica]
MPRTINARLSPPRAKPTPTDPRSPQTPSPASRITIPAADSRPRPSPRRQQPARGKQEQNRRA